MRLRSNKSQAPEDEYQLLIVFIGMFKHARLVMLARSAMGRLQPL